MSGSQIMHEFESGLPYRIHHITGTNPESVNFLPLHYDEDVTVCYFRRGGGSVRIEGRHYPIEEGDIILLNPRELHCFSFREGDHDRMILYIKEEILRNFQQPYGGFFDAFYHREAGIGNRIHASTGAQSGIHDLLEKILSLHSCENGWSSMLITCRIVELAAALEQLRTEAWPIAAAPVFENSTITKVLHYINENFLTIEDTEQLAGYFFMEKACLCRLFKNCVGISLWNYVIMRRLVYSNDLIRSGSPIEEASYRAGFQNYSNFFRLYKKYFGITPSEFRRQLHL